MELCGSSGGENLVMTRVFSTRSARTAYTVYMWHFWKPPNIPEGVDRGPKQGYFGIVTLALHVHNARSPSCTQCT